MLKPRTITNQTRKSKIKTLLAALTPFTSSKLGVDFSEVDGVPGKSSGGLVVENPKNGSPNEDGAPSSPKRGRSKCSKDISLYSCTTLFTRQELESKCKCKCKYTNALKKCDPVLL